MEGKEILLVCQFSPPPSLPVLMTPALSSPVWWVFGLELIFLIAYPIVYAHRRSWLNGLTRRFRVVLFSSFCAVAACSALLLISLVAFDSSLEALKIWRDQQAAMLGQHGCSLYVLDQIYSERVASVSWLSAVEEGATTLLKVFVVVFFACLYFVVRNVEHRQAENSSTEN